MAYCPDQLGPAVSRELGGRFDEVAFPRASAPEIVDWVDYATTVEHASTSRFVKLLVVPGGTEARSSGTSRHRATSTSGTTVR